LERIPTRPIDLALATHVPVDVVVPDIGQPAVWRVRLDVPDAAGPIRVCRIDGT
jgi:hypothetical protein